MPRWSNMSIVPSSCKARACHTAKPAFSAKVRASSKKRRAEEGSLKRLTLPSTSKAWQRTSEVSWQHEERVRGAVDVLVGLVAGGDEKRNPESPDPLGQKDEQPPARPVSPLKVVHRQRHRLAVGDI